MAKLCLSSGLTYIFILFFFQCLYNFFLKWDESLKSLFAAMQVSSEGLEWALFSVFQAK